MPVICVHSDRTSLSQFSESLSQRLSYARSIPREPPRRVSLVLLTSSEIASAQMQQTMPRSCDANLSEPPYMILLKDYEVTGIARHLNLATSNQSRWRLKVHALQQLIEARWIFCRSSETEKRAKISWVRGTLGGIQFVRLFGALLFRVP